MQYFNLLHLHDGITSNNFTQASVFWHLNQALMHGPQRAVKQVSPEKPPSVSLTVGCVSGAHGYKQTAYIRISLLAYCTYTLCQIKYRPQGMLSISLICTFFLYVQQPAFRKSEHIISFHDIPTFSHQKELNQILCPIYQSLQKT